MFSITTTPARQSVSETISILSSRLSSATLLEDRRAAILGLRSFAKEYPASVASGALRSLIGSLAKDGEDVDTVKVVLETLLMLFNPNESSPETSDELVLWLADEFTQRLENITLLLDFLDTNEFYSRLYSLQLLTAILAARTDRTEECVFTAPLGISRLVAILDDRRDVIRNEAIILLTYLTPTSTEIQKLVAFEGAFERIFKIIGTEGSVIDGGRIIEDCLILLANLLRANAHNQTLFRESMCTVQISRLLEGANAPVTYDEIADWAQNQANRNIYALLAVIRLFLVPGGSGTNQNQADFWRHGVLYQALQLSFNYAFEIQIRAEALATCSAIIRSNPKLQENFAQLRVRSNPKLQENLAQVRGPSLAELHTDGGNIESLQKNGVHYDDVFVIDGLLDLILSVHTYQLFDLRMAACECLKAYLSNHQTIRLHFLQRAIDGHMSSAGETANVLTALLQLPTESISGDPYRHWFAAVIMLHLIYDDAKAKAMAMAVTEGDESHGEEVVTSIQTTAAHLLVSINRGTDVRIAIGYLMLLLCWLYENLDGVNDFLGEGSNVQGLIQVVAKSSSSDTVVQGLSALLLGILYEFSTKDSPISRQKLHEILMGRMGRDRYINRLSNLRAHPWLRDFEVMPQKLDPLAEQRLPDVYFDASFVGFFKDNYSRLLRSIDRPPGMEISVIANGVQQGISRELVDSLRAEVSGKEQALRDFQEKISSLESALGQEQAHHRRTKETAAAELAKAVAVQQALQRKHDEQIHQIQAEHQKSVSDLQRQAKTSQKSSEAEAARIQRRLEAEVADLRATISRLEVDLLKANKNKLQEMQAARSDFNIQLAEAEAAAANAKRRTRDIQQSLAAAESKASELAKAREVSETQCLNLTGRLASMEKEAEMLKSLLSQSQEEKKATQTELDDLLIVLADLEEKAVGYKKRLKELSEPISDDETEGAEDETHSDENVD